LKEVLSLVMKAKGVVVEVLVEMVVVVVQVGVEESLNSQDLTKTAARLSSVAWVYLTDSTS